MKVVLRQDIENLGKFGETVVVKDGYARNYLIPKGLALEASEKNLKVIAREREAMVKKKEREKKDALALADKIRNSSCTVEVEVGLDDRMFGVVTNQDIVLAYEEKGIILDKRMIELKEPLRDLGVFYVPVRIHPEVTVEAKVWVVKK